MRPWRLAAALVVSFLGATAWASPAGAVEPSGVTFLDNRPLKIDVPAGEADTDELVKETGLTRTAIQRSVKQMRLREKVDEFTDNGGKARRGHPLQYRLVSEGVSALTHGAMGQKEARPGS